MLVRSTSPRPGRPRAPAALLSLSKLTTITEDTGSYSSRTQIQALSGGDVELPKLTTISGGPVQLESDGSGSTLNINVLTSIQGNAASSITPPCRRPTTAPSPMRRSSRSTKRI